MNAFRCALVIAIAVAPVPLAAEKPVDLPEPAEAPDWAILREEVETRLKESLFDPASAQIEWTSGFQWGYTKPIIGRRTWGWIACVTINAKNRFGGYVGPELFWVRREASGRLTLGNPVVEASQCSRIRYGQAEPVPLQPALRGSPSPALSAADELSKLADLLDKGLITRAEFDAQKAKLLGS